METRIVGVIGGGQLARMMISSARKLGIGVAVLDPAGTSSPAGDSTKLVIDGNYKDAAKIHELSSISDVITIEIEHVDVNALQELERNKVLVRPNSLSIQLIQDKFVQKSHFFSCGVPVPEFRDLSTLDDAIDISTSFGYPFVLKYDGRGNVVVKSQSDIESAFNALGGADLYAEKFVEYAKELAIMIVRTASGVLIPYPVVETVQRDGICNLVIAPAAVSQLVQKHAETIAMKAVSSFSGIGIYGVEMFLLHDDTVLINEIAPRPHNSGHYSIEACTIDQFEMHLRAVLDLPCPHPRMKAKCAVMYNLIGTSDDPADLLELAVKGMELSDCSVHWYNKKTSRAGRKMGHITLVGEDLVHLRRSMDALRLTSLYNVPVAGAVVGIIMGSDSDLSVMKEAAQVLDSFRVKYELTIVSAHRTPGRMYSYAQTAAEKGLKVIIAGAGGAAHLPGMVASLTTLPVIGVPMLTTAFHGNDSLLSIVQMPRGVPVAAVAVGNAFNAGLLAVRMLGMEDLDLQFKMEEFLNDQEEEVLRKAAKLEAVGYQSFLSAAK